MKYTCQYDSRCGGCDMLAFDYEKQLAKKKQYLSRLLAPYGKVDAVLGMSKPLHYRNKVHAVFTSDRKGNISSGIYEAGTHNVIPVKNCLIENETAQAIIATVTDLIKSFRLTVYDEDRKTGLFRHILVRTAHVTGQVMVTLVLSSTMFPSKNNFIKALREAHPEITTIVMNINNRRTSMVLGDREDVIFGRGYIEDELCGCRFCISSKSFYQVNSAQTEILYNKAMEFANLKDGDTVIDAYCGIGTIGITAAMNARKAGRSCRITGVELNASAVKDAIGNAALNKLDNIRFTCADAGDFMTELAARRERADVVFMDPPRTGSDTRFLSCLTRLAPSRIVYISCGPDTLARDLKYLTRKGYVVERMTGVDLFPMTKHVETVVLLSQLKQKPDDYINVTIELDDVDITSAETKATYDEIKKYVAEHNAGMKVSNLYISQVKRKCGIEVGKNYNLPKNEDSRQPQCPEDKESAIVEALKHFKMIQQK